MQRQHNCGVRLSQALNRAFRLGLATRPALEVERRLACCRQCPNFRGDDCAEVELHLDQGLMFLDVLIKAEHFCTRWRGSDPIQVGPSPLARAIESFQASERILAAMHRSQEIRSQAERRAARRAASKS